MAKVHREWDTANIIYSIRGIRITIPQMGFALGGITIAVLLLKSSMNTLLKVPLALIFAGAGIALGTINIYGKPIYRWIVIASRFWRQPRNKKWKRTVIDETGGLVTKSSDDGTTQALLGIKGFRNNMLVLANGDYRAVIKVGGVNIALLATMDQKRIYEDFKELLNSLRFPIQVLIRLRRQDIDSYLDFLSDRITDIPEGPLRTYCKSYGDWVEDKVETSRLISRERYIVVPYGSTIMDAGLKKLMKLGGLEEEEELSSDISEILESISHRVDTITTGLSRMGLQWDLLKAEELKNLIYESWNPKLSEVQRVASENHSFAIRGADI